jgi:hypothetical protein
MHWRACGIDHGRFLLVNRADLWGSAANRACKLGEDIGESGEIPATSEAAEQVKDKERSRLEPRVHTASSLRIEANRVLHERLAGPSRRARDRGVEPEPQEALQENPRAISEVRGLARLDGPRSNPATIRA